MSSRPSASRTQDTGVTLVELIVYVAVSALFAGLMASLFIAGLHSQSQTRDRDIATGKAQVVTDMLQASIRNADAVHVDGGALVAHVATGTTGWECRGWALTGAGALVYKHGPGLLGAVDSTWRPLIDPAGTQVGSASVTVEGGGGPFTVTGAQVGYRFTVTAGTAAIPITGTVTAQAKADGTVGSCW
ncbi:type IV pilus modification PilV family protein [Microbacterium sp.]|uniref:type IV pilus modification PilV family protein n=1 Tax=Microbacterium sp. TaxID=51671 RepID=UPI003A8D268F